MRLILRLCSFMIAMLISALPAQAFYTLENKHTFQEARGLLYADLGKVASATPAIVAARLMYDLDRNNWHFEYHQTWSKIFSTENHYTTTADRLNLSYSSDSFHIKLGRQAINFATTFFFSPNDFFSPFTASTFNRDYKAGVDALHTTLQLGALSQASITVVQDTHNNISRVLRFESASENISWMVLAAALNHQHILPQQLIGGSLQTDIFDNIGIRAEGHISQQQGHKNIAWVLGLEQRWSNYLSFNLEWFHHGAATARHVVPYSGSRYLAFSTHYTFTPLLSGEATLIRNIDDTSQLNSITFHYSLSDESSLMLYSLQPTHNKTATTEFGQYLSVTGLEFKVYF